MEINKTVKEFIEKNIKLIENKDLGALYIKAESELSPSELAALYSILRQVEDYSEWLKNTETTPSNFIDNEHIGTVIIPPNVKKVRPEFMTYSNIGTLHIEFNRTDRLMMSSNFARSSTINDIILNRDVLIYPYTFDGLLIIKRLEINADVLDWSFKSSSFSYLYGINPNIKLIISKNSKYLTTVNEQPLSEYLINIGFKNITVV